MRGIGLRSSALAEKAAFSCSAGGVIECTGFSVHRPQRAVLHRNLCGHRSGQSRSREDLGFGVMSLCPGAEQRFCPRFALDAELPLVQANLRAGDKNQPRISAGKRSLGDLVAKPCGVAAGAAVQGNHVCPCKYKQA